MTTTTDPDGTVREVRPGEVFSFPATPRAYQWAKPPMEGYGSSLSACLSMLAGQGIVSDRTLASAWDELSALEGHVRDLVRLKQPPSPTSVLRYPQEDSIQ